METSLFAWMSWTKEIAIFFSCIFLMLVGMTVWEIISPNIERKGFLPIRTTRGDRLFIGLLISAYINLLWIAVTDMNQWYATAGGFLVLLLIMIKG